MWKKWPQWLEKYIFRLHRTNEKSAPGAAWNPVLIDHSPFVLIKLRTFFPFAMPASFSMPTKSGELFKNSSTFVAIADNDCCIGFISLNVLPFHKINKKAYNSKKIIFLENSENYGKFRKMQMSYLKQI